jgi:hypothetical protein
MNSVSAQSVQNFGSSKPMEYKITNTKLAKYLLLKEK